MGTLRELVRCRLDHLCPMTERHGTRRDWARMRVERKGNLPGRAGLQIVELRLWQFQSNFLLNIHFHLVITSDIKLVIWLRLSFYSTSNLPSLEATTAVSSSPKQSCSMPSAMEGAFPVSQPKAFPKFPVSQFSISETVSSLSPLPL